MKTLSPKSASLTVQTRVVWKHEPIPVISLENGRIVLTGWIDTTEFKTAA